MGRSVDRTEDLLDPTFFGMLVDVKRFVLNIDVLRLTTLVEEQLVAGHRNEPFHSCFVVPVGRRSIPFVHVPERASQRFQPRQCCWIGVEINVLDKDVDGRVRNDVRLLKDVGEVGTVDSEGRE